MSWLRGRLRPNREQGCGRGCCGCLSIALAAFLCLSVALLIYAFIPNSYPSYPAAATAAQSASSYPSVSPLPWLHSNGRLILTSSGEQVLLRGMDVTGLLQARDITPGPVPTARDFAEMQSDGFDAIRVPISWSRLEPRPGVFSASYLNLIKKVVGLAAAHGIYSILDLHNIDWSFYYGGDGAPSWATAGNLPRSFPAPPPWNRHIAPGVLASYFIFWSDLGGWQRDVTAAWSYVARAFAHDSAVAAFDLWNEPHPFPIPPGLFGAKFLLPFEAQLMSHLARIAPRQMMMTEQSLDFGLPTYVRRIPYPNQIFSSHVFATLLEPPWQTPKPEYATPLRLLEEQAHQAGGAPWVGEIGAGPGQANSAWVAREMNELDRFRLGWAYWDWNEGGAWAFIRNPQRLPIVARAYPQATPGVLTSLAYDYQTGVLRLSFTGVTAGRQLRIAMPSFFRSYRVLSSSDPKADLSFRVDPAGHLLLVTIRDTLDHHSLAIQFVR